MFSAKTYTARRHELRTKIGSGIILLPGNSLSPNNYPNNAYYFRQDSSFRYYFGLNVPLVVGVIDADTGEEALYGDDFTVEDIPATLSSDAGTYVCNSLFYRLMHWNASQERVLSGFGSFPKVVESAHSPQGLPLDRQVAACRAVVREAIRYHLRPASEEILLD